jgi:hypothetical protein
MTAAKGSGGLETHQDSAVGVPNIDNVRSRLRAVKKKEEALTTSQTSKTLPSTKPLQEEASGLNPTAVAFPAAVIPVPNAEPAEVEKDEFGDVNMLRSPSKCSTPPPAPQKQQGHSAFSSDQVDIVVSMLKEVMLEVQQLKAEVICLKAEVICLKERDSVKPAADSVQQQQLMEKFSAVVGVQLQNQFASLEGQPAEAQSSSWTDVVSRNKSKQQHSQQQKPTRAVPVGTRRPEDDTSSRTVRLTHLTCTAEEIREADKRWVLPALVTKELIKRGCPDLVVVEETRVVHPKPAPVGQNSKPLGPIIFAVLKSSRQVRDLLKIVKDRNTTDSTLRVAAVLPPELYNTRKRLMAKAKEVISKCKQENKFWKISDDCTEMSVGGKVVVSLK